MKKEPITHKKPIELPDGRFVKGGWVGVPNVDYNGFDGLKDEYFEDVQASGVNLLFPVIRPSDNFADLEKFLNLCDKYNIYAIVPEEEFGTEDADMQAFCKRLEVYKTHPSVFGINLSDEPGVDKFPVFEKNIAKIRPLIGNLRIYVNHMSMYAAECQLFGGECKGILPEVPAPRYREFLDMFYSHADVDAVSYDFYPFRHEKGVCHQKYFLQLCIARDVAVRYGKPLWNFTQVTSWFKDTVRTMTYSEIAWLNNTSVACGVTGIQYFCYWTPKSTVEDFASGMVTPDGRKTSSYYFVKEANRRLDKIMPAVMKADFVGTVAFGDTLCYFPDEYNLLVFGNIKAIGSEGVLIGCYVKDGRNLYLVVNTSVFERRVAEIHFSRTLGFKITDGDRTETLTADKLVLTISEGEAVLIEEI